MKKPRVILMIMIIPLMLLLGACAAAGYALVVSGQAAQLVNGGIIPNTGVSESNPVQGSTSQSQAGAPAAQPKAAAPGVKKVASRVSAPSPALQAAVGNLANIQSGLEAVYQSVNPSVVSIQVVEQASASTNFQRRSLSTGPQMALGSGFVWDNQGDIVTNNHVISGASSITVTFADGKSVDATLVGADPNSDLAVVKVNADASELKPVQLADSSQVKVGQLAIAIGNPFGLQNTMTEGIISGLSRSLPVGLDSHTQQTGPTYSIPDIIQTDASINPGNSGGALVDIQGQLIGVTSAIESATNSNAGIGFVIPSEIINRVVPSLIGTGAFKHPWLGIGGTELTASLANASGLNPNQQGTLVMDVSTSSPAAKAGLRAGTRQATVDGNDVMLGGDVITAINGQALNQNEDLASYLLLQTKAGDRVTLTILRDGKQMNVPVTVGTMPVQ